MLRVSLALALIFSIERAEPWRWVRTLQVGEDPALYVSELGFVTVEETGRPSICFVTEEQEHF